MFWHNLRMGNKRMLGGGWLTGFPMEAQNDPDLTKDGVLLDPLDIEIMQYTGLKDKNGKEIYEGDLLKLDTTVGEVIFKDGSFQMILDESAGRSPLLQERTKRFEVTGNVYSNPELLKETL